jgi:Gpi18-like mannosyltransferase
MLVSCANIALWCFPGRRISEEEMRKAKEPEKPKVSRCSFLNFCFLVIFVFSAEMTYGL